MPKDKITLLGNVTRLESSGNSVYSSEILYFDTQIENT